jgi:hypothetical protein
VTGWTYSTDFPTPSGFATTKRGSYDAFVTKVNANGQSLAWSSYLGGAGKDEGHGIAVDGNGNVYVTGKTESSDFPTTGGFDTTLGLDGLDAFVTKVTAGGSLAWSSFLGGTIGDTGNGIAVDGNGNVYVTGETASTDFPTTGGFDTTHGGLIDAFVTKVNATGSLVWSSFLGGSFIDIAHGIAVDGSGNVYVTGSTTSTDFPTPGGFATTNRGSYDAFVTKVNANGQSLAWSSYLGGSSIDFGYGIAVGGNGNVYVTGSTTSADFPTMGGFDTALGGSDDAFVVHEDAFVVHIDGSGGVGVGAGGGSGGGAGGGDGGGSTGGGGAAQQAGGCGCTAAPSGASLVPWAFIALALAAHPLVRRNSRGGDEAGLSFRTSPAISFPQGSTRARLAVDASHSRSDLRSLTLRAGTSFLFVEGFGAGGAGPGDVTTTRSP